MTRKKEIEIVYLEEPEWGMIGQDIGTYNQQQAGESNYQSLCFVLKVEAPDQAAVGDIIGATFWEWFYIDSLWLKEEFRGQGHGHALLVRGEGEARQREAKNAYLEILSFLMPDFYKQHGYHEIGELPNFPAGHQRYFLTKQF